MTLLEQLQSHRGGLVLLKTQLFWYDGRGHDNTPGRVCLILDAAASDTYATRRATGASARFTSRWCARSPASAVLLLIEGQPQWVWVAEQDVELFDDG